MTANRPIPSASAMPATSVAAEARSRPGRGVDPPYPGRSYGTQRMPSRSAAGNSGSGGGPRFGVPWCQNTVSRSSPPSPAESYTCRVRPPDSARSVSVTTGRA